MKKAFSAFLWAFAFGAAIVPAAAGAEGACPTSAAQAVTATGVVNDGARVRSAACAEGTKTYEILNAGTSIPVTGKAGDWYRVTLDDGTVGYIHAYLLDVELPAAAPAATPEPEAPKEKPLAERVVGRILLQVEQHGEAWYVNPTDSRRYYMKDGPTAYEMMRAFGLGISEADFARLERGASDIVDRLRGRIVLRVEEHGEAYYIHPDDASVNYLKDGDAAYSVMRNLSLGITDRDLAAISARDLTSYALAKESTTDNVVIGASLHQEGEVPSNVDLIALNEYWMEKVNALRAERGLRQLVLDQRWVDTATEWAAYNGEILQMTHDRPDGKSMHQWIDTKGLDFTERYSTDGWKGNYFTENLSWNYTDNSQAGMEKVLDWTLQGFLDEAPYNGSHYRTTYHADWNSVGLGFYFIPWGENKWRVYNVFHYGALELEELCFVKESLRWRGHQVGKACQGNLRSNSSLERS